MIANACAGCGADISADRKFCTKRCYDQHRRDTALARTEKRCATCGEIKPVADFVPAPNSDLPGSYCRVCWNARMAADRALDPDRARRAHHKSHLKRRYGMSEDEYNRRLAAQGGLCAICRDPGPLQVDHSHVTGKTRLLLCGPCNRGLAAFRENKEALRHAIRYLEIFHA